MSSPPYVRDLLSIADKLTKSLSDRISKSSSLQKDCDDIASKLRNWRKNLPTDMEFLLKPTGDKALYRNILSPLSEMLCILCQLIWTAHELGKPPSLETISRTNEAEQKIKDASPAIKKVMDDLGTYTQRSNESPRLWAYSLHFREAGKAPFCALQPFLITSTMDESM
ncbi:hypothetical protein BDR22DRAFT_560560 [Usnea florida]